MKPWLLLPGWLAACVGAPASAEPRAWFAAAGERAFAVASVATVAGARQWLVVGGLPGERGTARLFAADEQQLAAQTLGGDVAYSVAVSDQRAAVGMANGDVLLLALPDLRPTLRWQHGKPAVAVGFSPDGSWLASGGADGVVRVGAIDGAPPLVALEHAAPVTCLAWAADSQRLVAGTRDGKVRLHERTGRLLRTWNRLGGEVVAVAWLGEQVQCHVRATPIAEPTMLLLPWP